MNGPKSLSDSPPADKENLYGMLLIQRKSEQLVAGVVARVAESSENVGGSVFVSPDQSSAQGDVPRR